MHLEKRLGIMGTILFLFVHEWINYLKSVDSGEESVFKSVTYFLQRPSSKAYGLLLLEPGYMVAAAIQPQNNNNGICIS